MDTINLSALNNASIIPSDVKDVLTKIIIGYTEIVDWRKRASIQSSIKVSIYRRLLRIIPRSEAKNLADNIVNTL
ncbi:hypothetical protein [Vibrio barjaei]|uniref:hypothetical protein n=1 Tax=Vibrio barjaei TaxID=1676683 RepID=UPI0022845464|nr:hypothetical protein [Vibrio barjaei]MCY9873825.1 hypothetical protein [Vibrio barjaei]